MNEGEGRGRNRKGDEKREEREGKVEERGRKEKWRRGGEGERKGRNEQNHATHPHLESAEGVFGGKVHSLWLSLVAGQPLPCATVGL